MAVPPVPFAFSTLPSISATTIVSVTKASPASVDVVFSQPATAGGGSWPGFTLDTLGGIEAPSLQTQIDPTTINLEFADSIDSPSNWDCTADDGGITFSPPLSLPESGSVIGA